MKQRKCADNSRNTIEQVDIDSWWAGVATFSSFFYGTGVYGVYLRDVGELWTMTVICDDVPQDRVK